MTVWPRYGPESVWRIRLSLNCFSLGSSSNGQNLSFTMFLLYCLSEKSRRRAIYHRHTNGHSLHRLFSSEVRTSLFRLSSSYFASDGPRRDSADCCCGSEFSYRLLSMWSESCCVNLSSSASSVISRIVKHHWPMTRVAIQSTNTFFVFTVIVCSRRRCSIICNEPFTDTQRYLAVSRCTQNKHGFDGKTLESFSNAFIPTQSDIKLVSVEVVLLRDFD